MSEHWTNEEYKVFRETGKMPEPKQERSTYEKLSRRVAAFAAQEYLKNRGVDDAEVILPEDKPKKRKYRNEPIIVDGIRFDSKHEAAVYGDLMRQVRAGILKCVCRQVGFDLPGNIRYFADFVVIYPDNHIEVLDAKSAVTRKNRVYINKKKQLKALWGIEIVEV